MLKKKSGFEAYCAQLGSIQDQLSSPFFSDSLTTYDAAAGEARCPRQSHPFSPNPQVKRTNKIEPPVLLFPTTPSPGPCLSRTDACVKRWHKRRRQKEGNPFLFRDRPMTDRWQTDETCRSGGTVYICRTKSVYKWPRLLLHLLLFREKECRVHIKKTPRIRQGLTPLLIIFFKNKTE